MELDLDAFIRSHVTSDEDDDDPQSLPHRTVDEILLSDSDSSSSSSSPTSSNRSYRPRFLSFSDSTTEPPSIIPQEENDRSELHNKLSVSVSSSTPKTLTLDQTLNSSSATVRLPHSRSPDSNFSLVNWIKSGTTDSFSLRPMFAGVGSNAKPGAALAAAAAASRSIPTPHAAAIKSRRAISATLAKVLDCSEELGSKASATGCGDSEVVSEIGADFEGLTDLLPYRFSSDEKFVEQDDDVKLQDNFQSAAAAAEEKLSPNLDTSGEGDRIWGESCLSEAHHENVPKVDELVLNNLERVPSSSSDFEQHFPSPVHNGKDFNLDENSTLTGLNNIKDDEKVPSSSADENHDGNAAEIKTPSFPMSDETTEAVEDSTIVALETRDSEDVEPQSKDGEVSLAGDDTTSPSDISDQKRRKKSRKSVRSPLELAEELEKKQASTGLHWEEGAAAQPMRLEGVRRGSTVLGYFDIDANNTVTRTVSSQAFKRDYGSPQVVAAHLNFIAVGMLRGVIMVFPRKYSPHHADDMDAKATMLGLHAEKSQAAVTSMCFNQQGDLLFAGYADGHITVWDVQKASALKVISEHSAPVVHLLYLGQDSQVTRQFNVVGGDSKGLVMLIHFTVVPWVNRYSFKTTKLLDETTSTVLCASPLLSSEFHGGALMTSQVNPTVSASGIGSMMGGVVGGDAGWKLFEGSALNEEGVIIFVTHQSALVAKVTGDVKAYAQLPKPDGIREGSMPYAAWKCMAQSHGSSTGHGPLQDSDKASLLAIAWDRKVQVAKLVKSELKIYGKWTLDSSAIGVGWLDDQMLVILTSTAQLSLFLKDGTMIHQTSFALDGSRGDDVIAYHTHFTNIFGNPEKAHHNCVAIRGATIYILGPTHLTVSRLLPWKERIEVLQKAGDWMGALNMAMTLYDGQAHGVIDLPRTLGDVKEAIMPYLVQLLLLYVDEVFSYISVAFGNQFGKLDQSDDSKNPRNSVHLEIKEQFTRVGGVAVEFCVHIKRTDILFDEILSRFVSVQQRETFLELLEPYILKDLLGSLPPEIMQVLVEHYSMKGWLQRVEQCVLHMDISSLDFNQVVRLCREHRLYGALIYLFNKGLDDFRAPLEELLAVLQNSRGEGAASLGYRMLVYLKYCFQGLAFPPGHGTLSPTRIPSLRKELLQFLLEDFNAPNSRLVADIPSTRAHPNLYYLLELDTQATLDVLRCALIDDEIAKSDYPLHDSANSNGDAMKIIDSASESQNLVQEIVDVLALILDTGHFQTEGSTSCDDDRSVGIWPSKKDIGHVFEFMAYYVSCERANVSKEILSQILEYLTSDINPSQRVSGQNIAAIRRREKQVLALLEVVSVTDWDASYLLHICDKVHFYQVCGFIHSIRRHYVAALDSYMKDLDEPVHAFSFINDTLLQLGDNEFDAFQSAVISRIPDLSKLCREGTFFLVVGDFSRESEHILSELLSHPESLFLYLKTVIEFHSTGTLSFSSLRKNNIGAIPSGRRTRDQSDRIEAYLHRISNFPKFLHNNPIHVTDEMIELYLQLLCRYERNSVLKFLETFESYRVEHCLRLCQEYGIIDATAFLLERVGDVGSALLLILSDLSEKFFMLDAAIRSVLSDSGVEHFNAVFKEAAVNEVLEIVHACIRLCQRNSPRLDPDESDSLWFRLLDTFCEPLMDLYDGKLGSDGKLPMKNPPQSLGRQEDGEACEIKWKVPKSDKGADILRKLFSVFIKEIVEGMLGYVRLPTIMFKLLSDNARQEFGDFKLTILGMLGTYDFEKRILDTAKSLIEDDTFYTMSLLKKGASHGYAPRSLLCSVCNCPLTKNSSSSSIQVFSCGHATHLQCELQENETSYAGSSVGCPICIPKKRGQKSRSKSALAENGLLTMPLSRPQHAHGIISLHAHESDIFETSYGIHPISRFELLTNLQKGQKLIQIEKMPQLRLAPPAVYHEKVKKGIDLLTRESSGDLSKIEKPTKTRQLKEVKVKGTSIRFPLKSNIFGKEKTIKQ